MTTAIPQVSLSIEPSLIIPTRTPEQCPHVVSLLSESFNAHVRCGSAMALGIGCAGTGNKVCCVIINLSGGRVNASNINQRGGRGKGYTCVELMYPKGYLSF